MIRRRKDEQEHPDSILDKLDGVLQTRRNPSRELLERLDELVVHETSFNKEDTEILRKVIGVWKWVASFKLVFPWLIATVAALSAFALNLSNIKTTLRNLLS